MVPDLSGASFGEEGESGGEVEIQKQGQPSQADATATTMDGVKLESGSKRAVNEEVKAEVDSMRQWLEPAAEVEASTGTSYGEVGLKESGETVDVGQPKRDGKDPGNTRAGIAGWTLNGAAKLTAPGVDPVAGATSTGTLLDGTWSAQQQDIVGQYAPDATGTGLRKADEVSRSYKEASLAGSADAVAVLSADLLSPPSHESRVGESVSSNPVRELREGLMEGMLEHSARVRASSAESLDISIRAAGGTEIAVQFSYVDGVVHAHAQCERGDFQLLSTLWHDLQLNLSKHGISLSTLVPPSGDSGTTTGSLAGGFGSSADAGTKWGQGGRPSREESPMETAMPVNMSGTVGQWLKLQSRRLFETWA
jgi:hypothetical protein